MTNTTSPTVQCLLETDRERIAEYREANSSSLFEAHRVVKRQQINEALAAAESVYDVKLIISSLMELI